MRRRIARTIVGVAALVVIVLGVPLAVVTQRFYESRAIVEMQSAAAQAIVELQVPLQADEIAAVALEPDAPAGFSVYDGDGTRLYGPGPDRIDDVEPDELNVVSPITDRLTETVVGSVRVSRPRSDVAAQARKAWVVMAIAAAGGLLLAMAVARLEAARLAAPIVELAGRAERLGLGEFDVAGPATGVAELDTLGEALSLSGRRLADLVAREREFSANASHQLRTPLAGLRVSIERGDLAGAESEVDRLSATIEHMLALARNSMSQAERIDIGPLVSAICSRWNDRYQASGRSLHASIADDLPPISARPRSIEQALDVILENSLRHATGETRVVARAVPHGLVLQVDDDGPGIAADRALDVLDRGNATDARIGLPLARALIEADGGRLLLSDPDRAEFRLAFASSSTEGSSNDG